MKIAPLAKIAAAKKRLIERPKETTMQLTPSEQDLLEWLSKEDYSQYGECYGKDLDSLVEKGLAQIHGPETEWNNNFIAKGHGIMFRAVSLTDAGNELARSIRR